MKMVDRRLLAYVDDVSRIHGIRCTNKIAWALLTSCAVGPQWYDKIYSARW